MRDPVLYVHGQRAFLVPAGVKVPAGDAEARRGDGATVAVDLAALEPHEVDADTAKAHQEARLAKATAELGQVSALLGDLLAKGSTSGALDAAKQKAGAARLREALQGLAAAARAEGGESVAESVREGWKGPGGSAIGRAVAEVIADLDGDAGEAAVEGRDGEE